MTNPEHYAQVVFRHPLHQAFTYRIPEALAATVAPGRLVRVSFAGREEIGAVLTVSDSAGDVVADRVHDIVALASPEYRIPEECMRLAQFVADYYLASPGEALAAASTVGFKDIRTSAHACRRLMVVEPPATLTRAQRGAFDALVAAGRPAATRPDLARAAGCSPAIIGALERAGLLEEAWPDLEAAPLDSAEPEVPHVLTDEQSDAFARIAPALDPPSFSVFLLHGITGSGKTELYLQAMARVLASGRTALCLVPEIALTPQMVERFNLRFGGEMGVFHSRMTPREKLILARKIEMGRVRIVIGARSAVFAPLPNLGLIVVDEEHDGSYKQGETPRYHGRDLAIVRARTLGIPVLLGSATPSFESYRNALDGKYELLRLGRRAVGTELPPVSVIDLTERIAQDPAEGLFSPELRAAITDRLARGEQSLLFLNRRGFSNFLFCPSCRWVARCDEDDVALTVHRTSGGGPANEPVELDLFVADRMPSGAVLRCHFCGARHPAPKACPECAREGLIAVGTGTQRVEEDLRRLFPDASILRLDFDTVGGRDGWQNAWERMVSGEAQIILGTQMIAKGLHLERVTLVGVVLCDVGLFVPDFRADERTFTLLTQVAGRAGRISSGQVIFQTYMPRHASIRFAREHDFEGFYEYESARRRSLGFPPFARLATLTISDTDRDRAYAAARTVTALLWRLRNRRDCSAARVNGPNVAPIARLAGRWRYRVMVRAPEPGPIVRLLRLALRSPELDLPASVRLAVDIDPVDLL